eukprot:3096864-Pyramimonas_sp.AAC.1
MAIRADLPEDLIYCQNRSASSQPLRSTVGMPSCCRCFAPPALATQVGTRRCLLYTSDAADDTPC